MKVIVTFGETKVVVPCGTNGDLSIRELIRSATTKYCKLSSYNNNVTNVNSDQVQLRLNNGAVVDPDDRVCDVVDDREELFAIIEPHQTIINSNGELSSSMTSSNLSTSISEHERPSLPPPPPVSSSSTINNRHEVIVTDADLRTRSLRIKTESKDNLQQNIMNINGQKHSPTTQFADSKGMYNMHVDEKTGDKTFSISLPKENSPLGIHVIPNNSNENQVNGLILQNIESDGRIKRQGILEINDRIIEINRINIEQCSFEEAQLVFRNALLEPELELTIVRSMKKSSMPFYLNQNIEVNPSTKRLGKIMKITLTKGADGLGFKLASRDNPTGAANPIYVKTIFGKGAAVEDGRLRNGDRLLTVNGIDVTQMSLQDTVGLLRETKIGDTVHLCISRQQDGSLPEDLVHEEVKQQIITFDIPLRDTSSAGLGITIKGKTSIVDGKSIDLGIFVKSILTGGAAFRDKRLRSNDQILIVNDVSLVNVPNIDAATILQDAVRKEIQPGFIKITISRMLNDEQDPNAKHVKEIELLSSSLTITNDENELDLTNFVSSANRKPPMKSDLRSSMNQSPARNQKALNEKQNQEEIVNENVNPFQREAPFRQSISEKRRLTQHPNSQAVQWKQRSFQDFRTNSERRQTTGALPDSSMNFVRSTSYESIQRTAVDEERHRQAKLRNRACNDSFRQAVDKSYSQNNHDSVNGDKSNKTDKQRFKFSNIFTTKSKRKENHDDKLTSNQNIKSNSIHSQSPPHDNNAVFYPPPPTPFSSRQDSTSSANKSGKYKNNERSSTNSCYLSNNQLKPQQQQQQGYQPYRFDSNLMSSGQQKIEHFTPPRNESKTISGKPSPSNNFKKPSHPPIPHQFLQSNLNGTQSLKTHQIISRSPYPLSFNVHSEHIISHNHTKDFSINTSEQTKQMHYPISSRSYLSFENPANV
ncbi:unnamed protein product [Rotaria socialis]|uniref:PDZ domain-containing protein n=2 Tax=Rotaria socialis TaxID=392032 RepID=A0A820EV28_9BILA|nr:unnamed protein product [Rotaria socialis]CAF3618011.1 unnamed protein product [Rotaria socialis]CAF4251658.1 unnamed protein product [Rotaria socialis]